MKWDNVEQCGYRVESVYGPNKKAAKFVVDWLYFMLSLRTADMNISHKKMPSLDGHRMFVNSRPYGEWYVIWDGPVLIGHVYLTRADEVGIFLLPSYQRDGLGGCIVDDLKAANDRLVANVAPQNEGSQKFFNKEGFRLAQFTYVWEDEE